MYPREERAYSLGNAPTLAAPPNGVTYQLERLEGCSKELAEVVTELAIALAPVIGSGPEAPVKKKAEPIEQSMVGRRIEDVVSMLSDLTYKVREVRGSLRL